MLVLILMKKKGRQFNLPCMTWYYIYLTITVKKKKNYILVIHNFLPSSFFVSISTNNDKSSSINEEKSFSRYLYNFDGNYIYRTPRGDISALNEKKNTYITCFVNYVYLTLQQSDEVKLKRLHTRNMWRISDWADNKEVFCYGIRKHLLFYCDESTKAATLLFKSEYIVITYKCFSLMVSIYKTEPVCNTWLQFSHKLNKSCTYTMIFFLVPLY